MSPGGRSWVALRGERAVALVQTFQATKGGLSVKLNWTARGPRTRSVAAQSRRTGLRPEWPAPPLDLDGDRRQLQPSEYRNYGALGRVFRAVKVGRISSWLQCLRAARGKCRCAGPCKTPWLMAGWVRRSPLEQAGQSIEIGMNPVVNAQCIALVVLV